jgi:hypothetical protein
LNVASALTNKALGSLNARSGSERILGCFVCFRNFRPVIVYFPVRRSKNKADATDSKYLLLHPLGASDPGGAAKGELKGTVKRVRVSGPNVLVTLESGEFMELKVRLRGVVDSFLYSLSLVRRVGLALLASFSVSVAGTDLMCDVSRSFSSPQRARLPPPSARATG